MKTSSALISLLPVLRKERAGLLRSFGASLASALCLTALGVMAAWAVGRAVVLHQAPEPGLWWWLAGLVVLRAVLTWREMDVSHVMAYRVLARLRLALFDAFARSSPLRRGKHSGRDASTALADTEKLEFFYAHTVAQMAAQTLVALACIVASAVLLPGAGLLTAAGAAALVLSTLLTASAARRAGAAEQAAREGLSARMSEVITATREVLSNAMVPRALSDAARLTQTTNAASRRKALVLTAAAGLRDLISGGAAVAVLLLGLARTAAQPETAATLAPLVVLTLAGLAAVADASTTLTQLQPLQASAARVAGEIEAPADAPEAEGTAVLARGPLGVALDGVSFAYGDGSPVLERLDWRVEPGEHIGISGPSGAGKSTLLTLMARLAAPTGGRLLILSEDEPPVPLALVGEESLRGRVAYVSQRVVLFTGTVRENLLLGLPARQPSPTEGELRALLLAAGLDGVLELDDVLGEGGQQLSGGQRARLGLARALLGRPGLLLVDEVTASLDPASEAQLTAMLGSYRGTVVMVSHRASTLASCSRVIRLWVPGEEPRSAPQGSS